MVRLSFSSGCGFIWKTNKTKKIIGVALLLVWGGTVSSSTHMSRIPAWFSWYPGKTVAQISAWCLMEKASFVHYFWLHSYNSIASLFHYYVLSIIPRRPLYFSNRCLENVITEASVLKPSRLVSITWTHKAANLKDGRENKSNLFPKRRGKSEELARLAWRWQHTFYQHNMAINSETKFETDYMRVGLFTPRRDAMQM